MTTEASIRFRFDRLAPELDERALRLFAATEAEALGRGGISLVSRITGLARSTILRGQKELRHPSAVTPGRVRRSGGGRKKVIALDPTVVRELKSLVEPLSRGDPMSPLRWTCKSIRTLADTLRRGGHAASHRWVWATLHELNYSLQGNRKMEEGNQHVDRNAQFEYINRRVSREMSVGNPVVSVDTKKKGRFRHPCGLDSEVFQSFRHQVQAAQVEKDRHPETFTIAKPTGHILNALNACVFRFGHRV